MQRKRKAWEDNMALVEKKVVRRNPEKKKKKPVIMGGQKYRKNAKGEWHEIVSEKKPVVKKAKKKTPYKMSSDRPKKNPVTGEYDDKLESMKTRAELQAKSNKRKKRTYKGDNPAGIRVSVSSKGTYRNPSGSVTHTDSSTRYGKEKLDKKGKEYQDFSERTKRKTKVKGIGDFSEKTKGKGKAFTGRKTKSGLYGDWLKD
jgi:hypothetical protein